MNSVWRVISPSPAGIFDGIGDFSARLTEALQPFGCAEMFVRAHDWRELEQLDEAATAGAVVQYIPQAFMRGDLRTLLRWLHRLRRANKPVVLVVHEYWPPLDGTLKRAAVRLLFRQMLRACIRASSAVVTSQEFSASELMLLARGKHLEAIPVGSSIDNTHANVEVTGRPLVLFGQPAALHAPTMAALGAWLPSAPSDVALTWLGRSSDEMRWHWCDRLKLNADRVTFAGGLPEAVVSAKLQASRTGLAPYENGAATRRTSFAALLAHALPVVAVDGLYTSDWLRAGGGCVWTPEGRPRAFIDALERLIDDEPRQQVLSHEALALFEARLSWPRIGEAYARLLSQGVSQ